MMQHVLVTGGNGFVGRQICKELSRRQIPVVSISRSGMPLLADEADYSHVRWVQADVFSPDNWEELLINCRAVIHTVGIIDEHPELDVTYEKFILQSAQTVANAAKEAGIRTFVHLSAAAGAPETPAAYMDNKRASEAFLQTLDFRLTILKPGLIYGADKPTTIEEHKMMQQLMLDPHIGPEIRAVRPLAVESVALVAVAAALDLIEPGVLSVDDIELAAETINA